MFFQTITDRETENLVFQMVEADLNGWFDRKQTEPDSASGHLFRIRIDGIRDEDPPSVHSVSREVAARVRGNARRSGM